jgi:hypothetical protein
MNELGEFQRMQRARKVHRCDLGGHDIKLGALYWVGVTLPGSGAYPIGGGDYEPVDWPFTVTKCCTDCYNRMMVGEL